MSQRIDGRAANEMRPVHFELDFVRHASGSVLITMGETRVLCNASVEESVPRWMKGKEEGWVTAEYAMLPASTHTRSRREIGKKSGRSSEIQRLIGRSLRACVDRKALGERMIVVDCDVLQADGGTRTASITGGFVALALSCARLVENGDLDVFPLTHSISAISAGIVDGAAVLDLPYSEDSRADVDLNLVVAGNGGIVEVQGTSEGEIMDRDQLSSLIDLGLQGGRELAALQQRALKDYVIPASIFGLEALSDA